MSSLHLTADCLAGSALDPAQHVNYALGMVLGKDDFEQEFAYLAGHDHWLAREALGYGTLSGLKVHLVGDELRVDSGVALTPKGQLVRVAPAQCARLSGWLASEPQRGEIARRLMGSPPPSWAASGIIPLHLVLCYEECLGQEVLIPGEPCRSETDLKAPSRIADNFRLQLRLDPPLQTEEEGLCRFVHLLRQFVDIGTGPSTADVASFVGWLRAVVTDQGPFTGSPPEIFSLPETSSPPNAGFSIAREDTCTYLRAALRLWTTELRPLFQADFFDGNPCGCDGPTVTKPDPRNPEKCLLLAELRVPLDLNGDLDTTRNIVLDETNRPILASLRFLQEWLLCGPGMDGAGDLSVLSATAETVDPFEPADADLDPATGNIHFKIPKGDPGAPGSLVIPDEFVHAPQITGGPFVPYHMVAAGRIGMNSTGLACKGLEVTAVAKSPGSIDLHYDGYEDDLDRMRSGKSQLIVKAIPIFSGRPEGERIREGFVVLHVTEFMDDFIRIYAARENGRNAQGEFLEKFELLVEISRFDMP